MNADGLPGKRPNSCLNPCSSVFICGEFAENAIALPVYSAHLENCPVTSTASAVSSSESALLHRWTDLSGDFPMPGIERRRVIGQTMMISQVSLKKAAFVPTHAHANEQFACIVSGALRFGIGAEGSPGRHEIIARAGEVL